MPQNTLLYELMQSEWLMDLRYLHQLRENINLGVTEKQKASEKEPLAVSFYNEYQQRINPENIQDIPEGSIAVINIVGMMMKYGNSYVLGADEVLAQLDFVNRLANVSAIICIVDGPGGAVSAITPFLEFSQRKTKPVISVCDTSLSLHYWIPCAISDHIMAGNSISARFGSVGVMTSWLDLTAYWEELGIKEEEVYSDLSEHKNEVHRKMKKNETAAKKMMVDRHLNPIAKKFQEAVKTGRPKLNKEAEGVLTGRTFGAEEARDLGMIDSIGTMQDAMNIAQILAEKSAIMN